MYLERERAREREHNSPHHYPDTSQNCNTDSNAVSTGKNND